LGREGNYLAHHLVLSRDDLLADALLDAAAPSELCGTNASAEDVNDCLSALRSAATGKVWRAWVKRWSDDPALASLAQDAQPWWRRWKR
jgi:hypothetical protein